MQQGFSSVAFKHFRKVVNTVVSDTKCHLFNVEPIVSTGVSQLFGGIVLLCVGLASGSSFTSVITKTSRQFAVFGVIIAASTVSYCLWFLIVQKEKLSRLFIIKFTEPLFAAFFGWILLGENIFNINYIVAFLLISVGILVENSPRERYN